MKIPKDIIEYAQGVFQHLQSTLPEGGATEAFRLPPFATPAQQHLFEAVTGEASAASAIAAPVNLNARLLAIIGSALDAAVPETWTHLSADQFGRFQETLAQMLTLEFQKPS